MKKALTYIKDFFRRADMLLLSLCLISALFGIVVIFSATKTYDNSAKYVIVQTMALCLGIALYVLMTIIDVDIFADKWVLLCVFNALFLLILIPFGQESETGNSGWLRFFGIGIQPSEVVKISYIIVMAKHISFLKEYRDLNSFVSVAQLAVHFLAIFGLLLLTSKDLGSALVYFFIFAVMLFAAGVRLYWFAIGFAGVAAVTPFIWTNVLQPYQKARILAPYVPSIDPTGYGFTWQANQSKIALASGQLTGTGLGNGPQTQSHAIFAKQSDFIFAPIGEELGMIGCCIVLMLLVAIVLRCVIIGLRSKNTLSMLVCFGVAATVLFQTFENIGMCIGIAPVIGITLPFFSYGGSSLFSMFAAMGLVSGVRYRPKPERFKMYR
ncbi:MAG: FtsW/RodA/SpoVE family cell cycle protein [Oscillospiraceae bacterium]